jgi:two-component sensor histidine kinase
MQSQLLPWIMSFSILLQFGSAWIGIWLIIKTKYFKPWIPIATAVLLMGARRLISFLPMVSRGHFPQSQVSPESIALVISLLMFIGMVFIAPMLKHITSQHLQDLAQKDLIIRESHHNIKNNLQMLESMLSLQEYALEDDSERTLVNELISRLQSVALLHKQLYQQGNIDINKYVESIIENSKSFHESNHVTFNTDISYEGFVPMSIVMNIGLILNEAITNSIKYAFNTIEHPEIRIILKNQGSNLVLHIEDNGIGIPEEKLNSQRNSFGLSMIQSIGSNPGWQCDISNNNGTKIFIQVGVTG